MVWWKNPVLVCIIACVIPNIGGFIGSLFVETSAGSWFDELKQPPFNPPAWVRSCIDITEKCNVSFDLKVFFPTWTILYVMIGFASFRVWHIGGHFARIALLFYVIQLILNWLWTPIFFGFHLITGAFIEIVIMWIFVAITIYLFFRVDFLAGIVMIPYIGWITFAAILSFSILVLNK